MLSRMLSISIGRNGLADVLFDQIAELRRLLNAGAALGAKMQDERAGVAAGEEVLPEEGKQQKRAEAEQQEDGNEDHAGRDEPFQQTRIAAAHLLEPSLKSALKTGQDISRRHRMVVVRLQQIHRQRWHQCSRENVRRQHGEDDRFGQRHEEIARDAAQEEHRQKHDADAERRHQGRHRDLRRAFEDRIVQVVAFFQIALDIFNRHGGVVHQDADGKRKPAERHDVDGLSDAARAR